MKIINFIKDFIARKKLLRLYKPYAWKSYDLRREIALFWDTPAFMPENSNKEQYEQLVTINSLGSCAGSGAINDYLAEYDECSILGRGYSYMDGKCSDKANDVIEFIYWASIGSTLSLEEDIFSLKFFFSRLSALEFSISVLRNFYSGIWIFDNYYLQRSKKFLFDLIESHWRWSAGAFIINGLHKEKIQYSIDQLPTRIAYDNPKQSQVVETIWKNFNKKEYRKHAKKYFEDWMKHLPSKKFLVLDQLLAIGNFNGELFEDYFGNIKIIYVWRDPRDQYERCRNRNMDYIPSDPIVFSKRFKKIADSILTAKHKNLLVIRLEEFCTNYDKVSKEIINFLGLDPAKHTKKFEFFDPEISSKKIRIHKTYHDQEAIKVIERELKEYCWDK